MKRKNRKTKTINENKINETIKRKMRRTHGTNKHRKSSYAIRISAAKKQKKYDNYIHELLTGSLIDSDEDSKDIALMINPFKSDDEMP